MCAPLRSKRPWRIARAPPKKDDVSRIWMLAELFEACNYDMAYVFKYSIRTGTPAAERGDQISDEVKERRNQALLDILHQNSLRRNESLIGTTQEVLVEGPDKTGQRLTGRTRGNRVAIFDGPSRLIGHMIGLKIERATVSSLYGQVE